MNGLKNIVGTIAPVLASALGSPLAGVAVGALSNAILGRPQASSDEIIKAIQSPDGLIKLKQAENQFVIDMEKIGLDRMNLEEISINNARNREIELSKAGIRDLTTPLLAFFITIGFFSMILALFLVEIPVSARDIVYILTGSLGTAWIQVVSYYFGSSSGSARKDNFLSKPK